MYMNGLILHQVMETSDCLFLFTTMRMHSDALNFCVLACYHFVLVQIRKIHKLPSIAAGAQNSDASLEYPLMQTFCCTCWILCCVSFYDHQSYGDRNPIFVGTCVHILNKVFSVHLDGFFQMLLLSSWSIFFCMFLGFMLTESTLMFKAFHASKANVFAVWTMPFFMLLQSRAGRVYCVAPAALESFVIFGRYYFRRVFFIWTLICAVPIPKYVIRWLVQTVV